MIDAAGPLSPQEAEEYVVTITIARDGRVLLHDLPAGLVRIVAKLNPQDPQFSQRQAAQERITEKVR